MNIIGIDVSKAKLDVLWLRDIGVEKVKTKVISNTQAGHGQLIAWLATSTGEPVTQCHCLMEATGIYHEALAYALHRAGVAVSVVNPAYIHDYGKSLGVRNKTDKKDSFVIAHYGAVQSRSRWQPEPERVRTLKALIERTHALEKDRRREQARLEHIPQTPAKEPVVHSIETVIAQFSEEIKRIEALINQHIDQYPDLKQDRDLLNSIPGVGPVVSRTMLSVLHSRPFDKARDCAAYLGLTPIHHESGSSVKKHAYLSKAGGTKVREKLYMAAVVCTRYNPDIKAFYQRLINNGKCKKSAVCAAMRKLVHICFGVIKHQQPYQQQTALITACS